jgi:Flp pilus assembly protein TadG
MSHDQRGVVTAELALGIPVLLSLTVGLVWVITIGIAQVRMVDAARETARAAARGDSQSAAIAEGHRVAGGGVVTMATTDGRVVATATDVVSPPGGLLGFLPEVRVEAEAVTSAEVSR